MILGLSNLLILFNTYKLGRPVVNCQYNDLVLKF